VKKAANPPRPEEIDAAYITLKRETESAGYLLNADEEFTRDLVAGLLINEQRFGYRACPCRLASGNRDQDRDIICPCDYRDPDIAEYGTCYCGLYVNEAVFSGSQPLRSIPERRPPAAQRSLNAPHRTTDTRTVGFPLPVWRCTVCGYLCGREHPPEKCPICKVSRDRFERFA
jgi:ferredoxin-thioredoxin reductase catalytic chain